MFRFLEVSINLGRSNQFLMSLLKLDAKHRNMCMHFKGRNMYFFYCNTCIFII